jgi:antirestriction protein ArdC
MSYQDEIRSTITARIVEALKSGQTPPWRRPWSCQGPALPTNISGRRYSGINVFCLLLAAMQKTYPTNLWGTYNQFRNAGGQIRKGEKASQIVLWKPVTRKKLDASGKEKIDTFPIMKTWSVFNISQCDGYPLPASPTTRTEFIDYVPAEKAIAATGADIRHGGNRAYYSTSGDFIQMPEKATFESNHGYYSTLLHEAIHWTMPRLKRKESYALEELVAETGGCFLSAELGIPQSDDLTNHVAYVKSWIAELENDHGAIFRAAKQASLACDLILKCSRQPEVEEVEEAGELVAAG